MVNKKGQLGTGITWFVGFLVIVFVLFLFFLFSFMKIGIQKTSSENLVTLEETKSFNYQQEQRNLFVLLEEETENKKNYDLLEMFLDQTGNKETLTEDEEEYEELENALSKSNEEYQKISKCLRFFLTDSRVEYGFIESSRTTKQKTFYYFTFPKDESLAQDITNAPREMNTYSTSILEQIYSFTPLSKPKIILKTKIENCKE